MELQGILPTMITPFDENGALDLLSLENETNFLIENGVNGVVPLGAAGEFSSLSMEEMKKVVEVTVQAAKNRAAVVVGVAATGTDVALDFAKYVEKAKADAIMLQPTFYLGKVPEAIYAHFKKIASAIKIPICIYDNPKATGTKFSPNFVSRLQSEFSNIKYLKVSSDIFEECLPEMVQVIKGKMKTFIGVDQFVVPALARGVEGVMTGLCTVAPKECGEMLKLVREGNVERAYEIFFKLLPYIGVAETGPMFWYRQCMKSVLKGYGVIKTDCVRLPLVQMDEVRKTELKRTVAYAGLYYKYKK